MSRIIARLLRNEMRIIKPLERPKIVHEKAAYVCTCSKESNKLKCRYLLSALHHRRRRKRSFNIDIQCRAFSAGPAHQPALSAHFWHRQSSQLWRQHRNINFRARRRPVVASSCARRMHKRTGGSISATLLLEYRYVALEKYKRIINDGHVNQTYQHLRGSRLPGVVLCVKCRRRLAHQSLFYARTDRRQASRPRYARIASPPERPH